jgi:hypothetical protein
VRQPVSEKDIGFSTRAIHDERDGGDLTPPIHQTSTFILGEGRMSIRGGKSNTRDPR